MKDKINNLNGTDNTKAYKTLLELEMISSSSNELYEYFDDFLNLLKSDRTYVRSRGFRMICSLAMWDKDNKINKNINLILNELDDDMPTNVRQCLDKINLLLMYKPELDEEVSTKLSKLNLSKYKDSMRPLIEKDIKNVLNRL